MKAKRIISILLTLALVLAFGVMLASCGGDDTCTHVDANSDGKCDNCSEPFGSCSHEDGDNDGKCDKCQSDLGTTAGGSAVLVSGGNAGFQVVIGSAAKEARTKIEAFVENINELVDNDVTIVNDLATNAQDVEIIFGSVNNRGDAFKVDEHYLGYKGFAIKVIGSKVQILAGSASKYEDAIKHLTKNVMGITNKTKELTDVTMTGDQAYEEITPTDSYILESAKIAGNNLDDYVIVVEKNPDYAYLLEDEEKLPYTLATNIQTIFYQKLGVWLEIVEPTSAEASSRKAIEFNIISADDSRATTEGLHYYVSESGNLVFDCEFPDMFVEHVEKYLHNTFILTSKKKVNVTALDEKIDLRNIFYNEFGAIGNGSADDFSEIKACHDYANKWGHIVNAEEGKVYYIGKENKGESIIIMTDTYWHGASFVIDDSQIAIHDDDDCEDCAIRNASIFEVKPSVEGKDMRRYFSGMSLNGGWNEADNTQKFENWPLDYTALVEIYSSARKIFIRNGSNSDGGDNQFEILLVHPDGTIDESTPLYYADDKPITIDAGGGTITNIANIPEVNSYIAVARNIRVTRSNVTVKNFEHILADEKLTRAPYAGIITVRSCNNVTFENILLQQHKARFEWKDNRWVGMGTYEIGGYGANDLKYINCDVKNFYGTGDPEDPKGSPDGNPFPEGSVNYRGMMGTNYCRNFYFKDCMLTSFDSHKGLGNLTIDNCTFEHINIIGSGTAKITNSTLMADGGQCVFNVREDYGATWRGDIIIENVKMLWCDLEDYSKLYVLNTHDYHPTQHFSSYKDKNGNYIGDTINYLPVNISITNLSVWQYTYSTWNKNFEPIYDSLEESNREVYLFHDSIYQYTDDNIAELGEKRVNRYIGTETLTINNTQANIKVPGTLNVENMVYFHDGKQILFPFKRED